MAVTSYVPITDRQRKFLDFAIGLEVPIDGSGNTGKITSLAVTSDGFITGHTTPGYDRGVFLGKLPSHDNLADWERVQ
ncbi:MAG: hypothetical protein ACYTEX_26105 [Planctomycetota bacterium]|jgi:hypothetical protein